MGLKDGMPVVNVLMSNKDTYHYVDAIDDVLAQIEGPWRENKDGYAEKVKHIDSTTIHITLARTIADAMGLSQTLEVDHIDRQKFNNCRDNLREATDSQQSTNKRSDSELGFRGIRESWSRWAAEIMHEGKKIAIGNYSTKVSAAKAYNSAAKELHGEFAVLNRFYQVIDLINAEHYSDDLCLKDAVMLCDKLKIEGKQSAVFEHVSNDFVINNRE
jgi:hypothetical protein